MSSSPSSSTSLDLLEICRLGFGTTSDVFLCQSACGAKRAVKKRKEGICPSLFSQEISIMAELDHPNIIEMFSSSGNQDIVMEYAPEGDLFEFALAKPFEPKLARFYIVQLMNVLDYIHAQNICHRDLKLENLFLDSQFQLKVGDFGLAGSTCSLTPSTSSEDLTFHSTESSETNSNESAYFYDCVGTENYMAPELINKQKYHGEQVDIFALGVILFSLTHGFPPYRKIAHASDPFYRLIMEKQYERYWTILEKKTRISNDADYQDLVNRLLEPNPSQRITLEEIKLHPWMHGEIYDEQEISQAMNLRKELIISSKQQQ